MPANRFLLLSVASLVAAVGAAFLFSYLTALPLRESMLDYATDEARNMALHVSRRLASDNLDTPMSGERLESFHHFVQDISSPGFLARVKVWNRQSTVVYSDNFSLIGKSFPDNHHLQEALEGNISREISEPDRATSETESALGAVIEVYVPLPADVSRPAGVAEIYLFYAPYGAAIDRQQRIIFGASLTGLLALYAAALGIAIHRRQLQQQRLAVAQKEQEVKSSLELNLKVLSQRDRLAEDTERHRRRLADLSLALTLADGSPGPLELGRELLGVVQQEVEADYASLALVGPDGALGKQLEAFLQRTKSFPTSSLSDGLADAIIRTGRTQYVADASKVAEFDRSLVAAGVRSYLGIAIRAEDEVVGILSFLSTKPDAFSEDRHFLQSFASICAVPLQRAKLLSLMENAKQELESTFDAVPDAVALIDEDRRVLRSNQAFARLVGMRVERVAGANVCRLLHGNDSLLHRCPFDKSLASGQPDVVAFREPHLGNISLKVGIYPVSTPPEQRRRFVQIFRVAQN
ncbi:MAG: GAF domain-containing protein [Chloroflexi bacterium]|nr:GAF domain-containing protein [Chloroflexota bacterium]